MTLCFLVKVPFLSATYQILLSHCYLIGCDEFVNILTLAPFNNDQFASLKNA